MPGSTTMLAPESRLRNPFPRVLSTADPISSLNTHQANGQNGHGLPPWSSATAKLLSGYDTPDRAASPAPNPFALPTLTVPATSTIRFVSLCVLWYTSSALSSNTGKVIMTSFRYPVTLTIVQFFFVAGYCLILSHLKLGSPLRSPTSTIVRNTLPMAAFQVGGHICSSLAISRVPVSTVHTIKALSPLVTVGAYAILFSISYSPATYISLLPLTLGVMLACSSDLSISNIFGLICAFGSTIIFVSQNIFFKKIMPTNSDTTTHSKLDKINLLYFSSGMAFLLMVPVWLYSDFWRLVAHRSPPDAQSGTVITLYFFLNGTVHFAQNILAFAILSSTSPVTYSIASLVKRIAVICLAIVWFNQSVHYVQGFGISLTAIGLWMYNNAKRDVEKGEKRMRRVEAFREGTLPQSKIDAALALENGTREIHASPRPSYSQPPPSSALHRSGVQLSSPNMKTSHDTVPQFDVTLDHNSYPSDHNISQPIYSNINHSHPPTTRNRGVSADRTEDCRSVAVKQPQPIIEEKPPSIRA